MGGDGRGGEGCGGAGASEGEKGSDGETGVASVSVGISMDGGGHPGRKSGGVGRRRNVVRGFESVHLHGVPSWVGAFAAERVRGSAVVSVRATYQLVEEARGFICLKRPVVCLSPG